MNTYDALTEAVMILCEPIDKEQALGRILALRDSLPQEPAEPQGARAVVECPECGVQFDYATGFVTGKRNDDERK